MEEGRNKHFYHQVQRLKMVACVKMFFCQSDSSLPIKGEFVKDVCVLSL